MKLLQNKMLLLTMQQVGPHPVLVTIRANADYICIYPMKPSLPGGVSS